MDVPVAITAITAMQIENWGLKDMFDLQQNVPGLIVGRSQTATTSNFSIRGVGSTSNNFGVESSVGLYVDGVYRSRQSSLINELVDVETVSVLRGPQGTLFGKNTASGAINVSTVAPSTDSNDAFFEVTGGDLDLARLAAGTNIVLSDRLAFRGTVFSSRRDGYVQDDNFGGQISTRLGPISDLYNDRDRLGLRMQLGYDNGEDFDMRVIADYAEIDETCCVALSRVDSLFSHGAAAQGSFIGGPDAVRMQLGHTVYTDFNYGIPLPPNVIQGVSFDDFRTTLNRAPISQNEDRGISVEMNKTYGNELTLTSVSAYREFDTLDDIDADFTDSEIVDRINIAEQQSFSQELRLAGSFGDSSNWVVGGYYFAQDIKSNTRTTGGADLQNYVDIGLAAQGGGTLSDITNGVTAFSQFVASQGGFFPPGAPAFPAGIFADDVVLQEHSGYAVFGQVDWNFSDTLSFSLGARFTDETKDIDAAYTQTNPGTAVPDIAAISQILGGLAQGIPPADPTPLLAVAQPNAGWGGYQFAPLSPRPNVREKLEDDQVTGTAKVTWYMNDSMMGYVSYSTGYKAGGTNADRIYPIFDQIFGPEKSKSAEMGFKGDLSERVRLSVAVYNTIFDDFQANSFTGSGFNLQNAGEMEVSGIEVEYTWHVFDNTSISGYFAHNKGKFNSFVGGTCWDATPFHTGNPDPGIGPGGNPPCDRSGEDIPYNPENRAYVGINHTIPLGTNDMFIRADYTWASELTTDGDNDPLTLQDDLGLVNVRIGVNLDSWNSSVTLWGRNVTDERYYAGSFDPPLLDNGRMNSYPSEPATWGITFRKNWD
jgi:outer membrane receptor protein involved in Fe transport